MGIKELDVTFSKIYKRIENSNNTPIIELMEEGSTPLAELVAQFEEGAKLLKICQNELKAAELKISKLDISSASKGPLDL